MLNKKQLEELKEYAALQFTHQECVVILGLDREKLLLLLADQNSKEYAAYETGRLLSSAEIRKAILTQAKNGSSPAQKQMLDLIMQAEKQNQHDSLDLLTDLVVFQDMTLATEVYQNKKVDVKGLFIKTEQYIDKDGEKRFKISPVKNITGSVELLKSNLDVYDDDIRRVI